MARRRKERRGGNGLTGLDDEEDLGLELEKDDDLGLDVEEGLYVRTLGVFTSASRARTGCVEETYPVLRGVGDEHSLLEVRIVDL